MRMNQKFFAFFAGVIVLGMVAMGLAVLIVPSLSFFVMLAFLVGAVFYARQIFVCPHCKYPILVSGRATGFTSPGTHCKQCGKEY